MAVSISFGLMAATLLTLLYVPALYLIIRDISNLIRPGLFEPESDGEAIEDL
jgi:hypothetical protein